MLSGDQLSNLRKLVGAPEPGAAAPPASPARVEPLSAQGARLAEYARRATREAAVDRFLSVTRSVAICSGKGGVGKSNLAVNLAVLLARLGKRTVLIDADLGLANDDILLGIRPAHHLYHFMCGQRTLDEILVEGPAGMKLLPGGSGISELANLREAERRHFLDGMAALARHAEILLVDTSAGLSRNVVGFALSADDAVVVATPEPTSLLDAFGMVKALVRAGRRTGIYITVNRARSVEEAARTLDRLRRTAMRFLAVGLHDGGYILEDPEVPAAVRAQTPFILRAPACPAARSLETALARIFGLTEEPRPCHNPEPGRPLAGFLGRLASMFDRRGKEGHGDATR